MPKEAKLEFKNFHRIQRSPYVIYGDFECLLEKIDGCQQDPTASYTQCYQRHTPCGYGLVETFGCCNDTVKVGAPQVYRGEEPVKNFLCKVVELAEEHQERYNCQKKIEMSEQDKYNFKCAQYCYLCKKGMQPSDKAKDHCHLCGKYRGAAHLKCNIGFRLTRDVTVLFHNLRRYDGHLIMQEMGKVCTEMGLEIECTARGLEDYMSFSIKRKAKKVNSAANDDFISDEASDDGEDDEAGFRIRFIDTMQFLPSSLQTLVENLKKKGEFKAMKGHFGDKTQLLLRKGIYPYEYMDSWQKFEEKTLPQIAKFHSSLNDSEVSMEDYEHAQKVWNEMEMNNLGEYHDLYLCTDILLLCDVFENFRLFCLEKFMLDPVHYITLPSFAWDACLKLTGVQLDLLTDPDMYAFFEEGIRGGVSVISHRHAKANNKYLPNFDASLDPSYIMYLDANNLYGWSMVQKLPCSNFRWMTRAEIDVMDWSQVNPEGCTGYVLEVDLEYPQELHDSHNDYPLAPERLQVNDSMLSDYCSGLKQSLNVMSGSTQKLVPNLMNKQKYKLHLKNLQLYMKLGMKLTHVHRVISFRQHEWMEPYIRFNTEMRKNAQSDFEKDLYKLLNNAVFGKTMENVRAYIDVKLVTCENKYKKLVASPRYNMSCIFNENLVAVKMDRCTIQLCKPIYVGFTVLDLSKTLMYDFHYNYMKCVYNDNCKLLFTDTDSLCYHVFTDDIYNDMSAAQHLFDTSDYPADHPLFSTQNKKVLGKMKDETPGTPIEEFVGLRSKMYSIKCGGIEKKRAKGVKKSIVQKKLKHQTYFDTLFNKNKIRHSMNMIRATNHIINTIQQNKISLSAFDDKRYILNDGVTSYAYGHCDIDFLNLLEEMRN
jgi:hypothetical protein